jgi:hypothetical protein
LPSSISMARGAASEKTLRTAVSATNSRRFLP